MGITSVNNHKVLNSIGSALYDLYENAHTGNLSQFKFGSLDKCIYPIWNGTKLQGEDKNRSIVKTKVHYVIIY